MLIIKSRSIIGFWTSNTICFGVTNFFINGFNGWFACVLVDCIASLPTRYNWDKIVLTFNCNSSWYKACLTSSNNSRFRYDAFIVFGVLFCTKVGAIAMACVFLLKWRTQVLINEWPVWSLCSDDVLRGILPYGVDTIKHGTISPILSD